MDGPSGGSPTVDPLIGEMTGRIVVAPHVTRHGEGSLVTLIGEIDAALRETASASMVEIVRRGGPVVIDAGGVTFIDSSGLAFVLQLHRVVEEDGQSCTLRNPPAMLLETLELIGMGGRLRVDTTDEELAPAG